jgi:hypothetical protein
VLDGTAPNHDNGPWKIRLGNWMERTPRFLATVAYAASPVSTAARGFFVQEPGIPADAAYGGIWVYTDDPPVADSLASVLDVGMIVDVRGV